MIKLIGSYFLILSFSASAIDLSPISNQDWNYENVRHLLSRSGFGATPDKIETLLKSSPSKVVQEIVYFNQKKHKNFIESGIFDPSLDPFPPSRPFLTKYAKKNGGALGVKNKQNGNRKLQPVVDRFFYWLRASKLETKRLSYWWANEMLNTDNALQEKMVLFWHNHFATSEEKVRDYRKMQIQNDFFRSFGLTNFEKIIKGVSKDPAMLVYLDAGKNIKGAPNENFAREILELFTMGYGNYTEQDIRESARAFTGWNQYKLNFVINDEQHDNGIKKFLNHTGSFNGNQIIDLILEKQQTAEFIASKLYSFFVNPIISNDDKKKIGLLLKSSDYDIREFLHTIFLSKDFYSNKLTKIKSPVELVVGTHKLLDLDEISGVPDFNLITSNLGQSLFFPPTVAGWSEDKDWITPSSLIERGNFIFDMLFTDINFIPPDRYPSHDYKIKDVNELIVKGLDVHSATKPLGKTINSMSMLNADKDEDFNTRLGSYRGWQKAIQKVKPIPRFAPKINLTQLIKMNKCESPQEIIDFFTHRFLNVPLDKNLRKKLIFTLENQLGTDQINITNVIDIEQPLRTILHLILSLPEYQLS